MEIQDPNWSYVELPPSYDPWLYVTADCRVRFNFLEQAQMHGGLEFSLTCRLKGADGNDFLDLWYADVLFEFGPPVTLPQAVPLPLEQVTFQAYVRSSALDEDDVFLIWGDYLDDVFAEFYLYNPTNDHFHWATSPIISSVF